MSQETNGASLARARPVRLVARPGAPPLGAIFGGIGLAATLVTGLLRLDRLPLTLCYFKALTGLPCPTCGSTRALGRLFALDVPGALAMNPVTTLGALLLAGWALADLTLWPRRASLRLELAPQLAFAVRTVVLVVVLASWAYLVAAGR